jgi:hypothetical protein
LEGAKSRALLREQRESNPYSSIIRNCHPELVSGSHHREKRDAEKVYPEGMPKQVRHDTFRVQNDNNEFKNVRAKFLFPTGGEDFEPKLFLDGSHDSFRGDKDDSDGN